MKAHFPPPSRLRLSRRAQAGFSLVELLIAAAILAVTVSGFYLTFGGANELATKSRLNTSAKILLGAAVNEALSSRWSSNYSPEVSQITSVWAEYDTKNEGPNARPVPRPADPVRGTNRGVVNFFTSPNEESVVTGHMQRFTTAYTEPGAGGRVREDMRVVKFRVKYTYKGVDSPWLEIATVITRD